MSLQLIKNIEQHIDLSKEEKEKFVRFFNTRKVDKKKFFLEQGSVCTHEAFIINGCFRVFTTDIRGNEHVLYFAIENWWLSDIDSFSQQRPSFLSIQALEDSEVLTISKQTKENAYQEFPKMEELFRKMTQKFLVANQRRIIQNHSLTADQRYQHFLKKYPNIASKLTNIQIASYLGISHEFLSKIRRKIVTK